MKTALKTAIAILLGLLNDVSAGKDINPNGYLYSFLSKNDIVDIVNCIETNLSWAKPAPPLFHYEFTNIFVENGRVRIDRTPIKAAIRIEIFSPTSNQRIAKSVQKCADTR